jgi:hypothetical protein
MPRNGAGVASPVPGFNTVAASTTILSALHNSGINDIFTILNSAWPVSLGGTGGTTAISSWDAITAKGTDIASASTIVLTTATGPRIDITGVTAITAVTLANGSMRIARATGIFVLTASATLIVNKSTTVNYTTAVGDLMIFTAEGAVTSVTIIGGGGTFATPAQALAGTSTTLIVNPAGLYYPTGHLFGLTLSNNAGTPASKIDVAAGTCRDSGDTANIALAAALTAKDLAVAWAVGASAGMLATGVAVANGTYHIFLIKRPDTGVVDIAADTSVTGANIATNTNAAYTLKRRIGSIIRSGGSILAFSQNGDEFLLSATILDINANNPGSSAVTRTLTVPLGVKVYWFGVAAVRTVDLSTQSSGYFSSLDQGDEIPSDTSATIAQFTSMRSATGLNTELGMQMTIRTNTSAQIRSRVTNGDTDVTVYMTTFGWIDNRGRLD